MDQSIFDRYAARCDERAARVATMLEDADTDSTNEALLESFSFELHDFVGEARLLGFDKLAGAATRLMDVIKRWKTLDAATQGPQLQNWLTRLLTVGKQSALSAPTDELVQELQLLRAEFDDEHGAGKRRKMPTDQVEPAVEPRCILLFDDSPVVRDLLTMELEARGHRVLAAVKLDEFYKKLTDEVPDIVFLDINMPEMSGDQICRKLRGQVDTQHFPIVFLSSLPPDELGELAERSGANGFLSKQEGMDKLVEYLDKLLSPMIF